MYKAGLILTIASLMLLTEKVYSETNAEKKEKLQLASFPEEPPPMEGEFFVEQDECGRCLYGVYEPCPYDVWFCEHEPIYHYKKCYRYVPEYYNKCYRQYVPQYYYKECCRYIPEEYCTVEVCYVPKRVSQRKCRWEPRYYWKDPECVPYSEYIEQTQISIP